MTSAHTSSIATTISASYSLSNSQITAVEHCLDHDSTLLVASKGAGKTRTGLVVAAESEGRTLILCPNKVRSGWVTEGRTIGVDVHLVDGDEAKRQVVLENPDCQICVMGVDLIPWFVDTYRKKVPFTGLILDETTRFSSPGSKGVKKLRVSRREFDWVLGMTAQPVMEDPLALYGQALVIDGGECLGKSFDQFKQRYFLSDFMGYKFELMFPDQLAADVAPLVYVMEDKTYDRELVPLTEETVPVAVEGHFWRVYEELCEEAYVQIKGQEIEAVNEAVLSGKLEQLTQGFLYDTREEPHWITFAKLDALTELLKTDEPIIVTYSFVAELAQLRERFPWGMDLNDPGALAQFTGGDLNLLFMHPRSGSHGINAQARCCEMICLKPIWSADGWDQVIGRIRRRGQTRPCRRRTLVVPGSIDELILDRVAGKEDTGSTLLRHIKEKARR